MSVLYRPCGDITKAPTPRSRVDTMLYERLSEATGLTITVEETVDYEDWIEPACLLDQALKAGYHTLILPALPLPQAVQAPLAEVAGVPCRDILIGRLGAQDDHDRRHFDLGWPLALDNLANHYPELTAFKTRAGRRVQLADMPGEAMPPRESLFGGPLNTKDLGDAMVEMGGEILVKQVHPAKSLPLMSYSLTTQTPEQAQRTFIGDIGYHFCRFEGEPAALLVQDKISMRFETRFFVFDGEVVSGAAALEYTTPQQRATKACTLPTIWEHTRNSGVMDDRDYAERKDCAQKMVSFAQDAARAFKNEAPDMRAYTLDVAMDATDTPVIIELNPAARSGLFANDAKAVFEAIVKISKTAPRKPAEPYVAPDVEDDIDFVD